MTSSRARLTRVSKYLSLHLRHRPDDLGLTLGPGGWVLVDELLRAAAERGFPISYDELVEVVASNDKRRFALDEGGTLIRANQGHSVEVDLELERVAPPPVLYHGSGRRAVPAILAEGLRKMQRHHVHLSPDQETAHRVGARHGHPTVFAVDAEAMARDGHAFYRSANGVWLTDSVPATYLTAPG
jgi:putative RNA 2'-phosphotransferase